MDFAVQTLPLRTPTLPPAEHTNAYFAGDDRFIVIDPAPYDPGEREILAATFAARLASGHAPIAVVLTHHHPDHMGAAEFLRERFGVPIWAHPITRELLRFPTEASLDEGDRIELGAVGSESGSRALRVLFTPGHAPGHLVLLDDSGRMFVGDMVAGIGSILIDPDDGDMGRYIAELDRLAALEPKLLYPAHGPAIQNGGDKLRAYAAHRRDRERKVLAALADTAVEIPALLPSAYADTPPFLYGLAERACLSHLKKLAADGLAEDVGGSWRRV